MYFPFKEADGFLARLAVLFILPPWSIWVGWRNGIDLFIAFNSLYAFVQGFAKWLLRKPMVTFIRGRSSFGLKIQNSSKWVLYLNKLIENMGFHFSDRVITNNTAIQEEILKDIKIALGAVAPTPMRARKAEEILRGRKLDQRLLEKSGHAASDEAKPIDDIRGSADYRKQLVAVLTKRAITQAIQQAEGR